MCIPSRRSYGCGFIFLACVVPGTPFLLPQKPASKFFYYLWSTQDHLKKCFETDAACELTGDFLVPDG